LTCSLRIHAENICYYKYLQSEINKIKEQTAPKHVARSAAIAQGGHPAARSRLLVLLNQQINDVANMETAEQKQPRLDVSVFKTKLPTCVSGFSEEIALSVVRFDPRTRAHDH
jgi:hypothetical protein